jgi:malonyl-CoA O-methyltransferase
MKSETVHSYDRKNRRILKSRIAASFGLKVAGYENNAVIQQKLLTGLVPQLLEYSNPGEIWADFGCGGGGLEKKMYELGWQGKFTGIDIAFDSLHYCRKLAPAAATWVCGDVEFPPFKRPAFSGIVAASVLQWSGHLERTLTALNTLLIPGGYFLFSFFTKGSFHQLIDTRSDYGLPVSVIFPPDSTVEPLLRATGYTPLSFTPFSETVTFPSAKELLRHFSSIGSTGSLSQPLSRSRLQQFCRDLEHTFGTDSGVPLTYNALYGTARKGDG